MTLTSDARARMIDLLEQAGPDAPTLCPGWVAHDLAAHLVTRDRHVLAMPGYVVGALHGLTRSYERRERRRPYADLLARLRAGAPAWTPTGLPPVQEVLNLQEWFVHGEDVRRGDGAGPEQLAPQLQEALWARARTTGSRLSLGLRGPALRLQWEWRDELVHKGSEPPVVVAGPPGEVLLWLSGRRGAAQVQVTGPVADLRLHAL